MALNFKFVGKFPCVVIGLKFADKQLSCGAVTGDSNLDVLENLVFDYSNDSFCAVLSWDTFFDRALQGGIRLVCVRNIFECVAIQIKAVIRY